MTTFTDGPAKGQALMLHRAPVFLRVTQVGEKFDALDQPEDTPMPSETVFAYQLATEPAWCHINRGSKGGGFYAIASYRLVPNQPEDWTMRVNSLWVEWCHKQPNPMAI